MVESVLHYVSIEAELMCTGKKDYNLHIPAQGGKTKNGENNENSRAAKLNDIIVMM